MNDPLRPRAFHPPPTLPPGWAEPPPPPPPPGWAPKAEVSLTKPEPARAEPVKNLDEALPSETDNGVGWPLIVAVVAGIIAAFAAVGFVIWGIAWYSANVVSGHSDRANTAVHGVAQAIIPLTLIAVGLMVVMAGAKRKAGDVCAVLALVVLGLVVGGLAMSGQLTHIGQWIGETWVQK